MIKIITVQINTTFAWADAKERMTTWQAVNNVNSDWQQLTQTALIARPVNLAVDLIENNWAEVKSTYPVWQNVKSSVSSWQGIRDI